MADQDPYAAYGGAIAKDPYAAYGGSVTPQDMSGGAVGSRLLDIGKGALASALQPVYRGGDLIRRGLGMERVINTPEVQQAMTPPDNTFGTVGAGLEQAGELAVGGGALRAAATRLTGRALPMAARYAVPVARIGAEAVNTGGNAYLHGQDPVAGAALGAAGGAIAEGAQAVAPAIAEGALGIRRTDRMHGSPTTGGLKTPGEAALKETSAVGPMAVADQAQERLNQLNEMMTTAASGSNVATSPQKAIQLVEDAMNEAKAQNAANNYKKLQAVKNQLTTNFMTGEPLAANNAIDILNLRRGVDDLVTTWNPQDTSKAVQGTIKQVRHALGEELHAVVPNTADLDQQISNLIPVAKRGSETAANAGITQNAFNRLAAHTGALTGATAGGVVGYKEGGLPGAAAGAAAGILIPEALANPATRMAIARAFASPIVPGAVIPIAKGLALQAVRGEDGSMAMKVVRGDQ